MMASIGLYHSLSLGQHKPSPSSLLQSVCCACVCTGGAFRIASCCGILCRQLHGARPSRIRRIRLPRAFVDDGGHYGTPANLLCAPCWTPKSEGGYYPRTILFRRPRGNTASDDKRTVSYHRYNENTSSLSVICGDFLDICCIII